MAILKHLSSKSSNYTNAVQYLQFEYDKLTNRPIHDQDGNLIMRQNFLINGINCHPATFALECKELNEKYHKNNTYNEIKSHHYILSFDPKDASERLLTPEQAQTLGMDFAKKNFPGHQTIVCTHEDGDNHSGNIHVHIILNSLRKEDVPRQDYMERPCDSKAGYKHHVTRDYLRYLKSDLMQTCQHHNLHQIDLLKKSRNRRLSQSAYWASLRSAATTSTTPSPTPSVIPRPSILAQLQKPQSRRTRINDLKESAQALAYLQDHGYSTLSSFEETLQNAKKRSAASKRQLTALTKSIDQLNAQLHYTGRYYTHKKTYQAFLKSENKGKYRKEHSCIFRLRKPPFTVN